MNTTPVNTTAWDAALAFVWRPENDGADNNSAPGETFLTRWGVTEDTWGYAQDEGVVPGNTELRHASQDQLATVLRTLFWNVCSCDRMAGGGARGVALMVFNMAMVAGPGRAARLLQRLIGATEDGQIGPLTVSAMLSHTNHLDLIDKLAVADEAFFASLEQAGRFLKGWDRRAEDAKKAAILLENS